MTVLRFGEAGPPSGLAIFGFSEFLAAFALLVLVYNVTDIRYRFRIATAPLNFRITAFAGLIVIGVGSLINDAWAANGWLAPRWGATHAGIQICLATGFLLIILGWMYFSFIRPPRYSRRTAIPFLRHIYHVIVNGSEHELREVAHELLRSADGLVEALCSIPESDSKSPEESALAAHDIMRLLASRRMAKQIASKAPSLIINLVNSARKRNCSDDALAVLINSVVEEAIRDQSSLLFDETEKFRSDIIGRVRPMTNELFGDFKFVEDLSRHGQGPLDVHYKVIWSATPDQFRVYCQICLRVFQDYVKAGWAPSAHSFALYRAFHDIERSGIGLYKLKENPSATWESDEVQKFRVAVEFVASCIEILNEKEDLHYDARKIGKHDDILDALANLAFELCLQAAEVDAPLNFAWVVQHNIAWDDLFPFGKRTGVSLAIYRRLSRLFYDEIKEMEKYPNFRSAKALGFLLNIFGLRTPPKGAVMRSEEWALAFAVKRWTHANFHPIWKSHRRVAEACLIGGITYDKRKRALVKTYTQGIEDKPNRSYLPLANAD